MWASGDELRMEDGPEEKAIKPLNRLLSVKPPYPIILFFSFFLFFLNKKLAKLKVSQK